MSSFVCKKQILRFWMWEDPTSRLFQSIIRHSTIPAHFPSPNGFHSSCFFWAAPLKHAAPTHPSIYIYMYVLLCVYIRTNLMPTLLSNLLPLKTLWAKYTREFLSHSRNAVGQGPHARKYKNCVRGHTSL